MTNLEWIKTLSEEEFADWLYDEWLHHLQYRWSSSRGGLIIWLKDRKTENSSEKPNNSTIPKMEQVDKDINVRSKDELKGLCKICMNYPCSYWDEDFITSNHDVRVCRIFELKDELQKRSEIK